MKIPRKTMERKKFTLTFSLERSKLMLTIEDPLCHWNYLETVMQTWDREINP